MTRIFNRPDLSLAASAIALAALTLVLAGCGPAAPASEPLAPADPGPPSLIPAPARLETGKARFEIAAQTPLFAEAGPAADTAAYFADLIEKTRGWKLPRSDRPDAAAPGIAFVLDPSVQGGAEAYRLYASPDGIRVAAAEAPGLFYGAVTLWQLATADDDAKANVPAVRIEDAPRFGWRGFMLDSARHYQSVDEIKRLLDAMALHKLNVFHWHLTDDQGWRIEIKRYPKLTEVGGCRIPLGDAGRDPTTGEPRRYCGWYTQDQIREVVRYAADRHIMVVPEIDVPGHATAAIAAYPELGITDTPLAPSGEWGVFTNLFNVEESTFQFLENVLSEVVELFPGRYVHVGGDEAVKDQWKASARVQARMRQLGVEDEDAMQSHLIRRLEKFLIARDRRLIGWDEILEGGLPPEATVMSWRGTEGGLEAAREGHDVVMSPSSATYLDYLQTESPNEPPGRRATISLADLYAFEPIPDELEADKRHHILGLQANLWTEHTRTFERLQHHMFPRLAALAETGWTPRERKDYPGFLARLPAQLERYRALGIDYAQTPFQVDAVAAGSRNAGTAEIALENPLGYPVRYTLDGSEPDADSTPYSAPFQVRLPAQVRAAAFFGGRPLAPASEHRFDAASLLTRDSTALSSCPKAGRLLLRLEDDGPAEGERARFDVPIFYPCWEWKDADLEGIRAIQVRAGRMPYNFQLAFDEPNRRFEPAATAHGELQVRGRDCRGAPLAVVPLPADPGPDGFATLRAPLPENVGGRRDICLLFTGDTRPRMWVVDRVTLQPE